MTDSEYYAKNIGRHLAKIALCKFIESWAKNRTAEVKGKKTVATKFAFFSTHVEVGENAQGEKTINGHLVNDFWRYIDESSAKQILCEKRYLVKGLCSWDDLWQALKINV